MHKNTEGLVCTTCGFKIDVNAAITKELAAGDPCPTCGDLLKEYANAGSYDVTDTSADVKLKTTHIMLVHSLHYLGVRAHGTSRAQLIAEIGQRVAARSVVDTVGAVKFGCHVHSAIRLMAVMSDADFDLAMLEFLHGDAALYGGEQAPSLDAVLKANAVSGVSYDRQDVEMSFDAREGFYVGTHPSVGKKFLNPSGSDSAEGRQKAESLMASHCGCRAVELKFIWRR